MSLRYQINLRVFLSAVCILFIGGSITIWQARNAVDREVGASINLAVQLIKLGFTEASPVNLYAENSWLRLDAFNVTRHLSIQLKIPSGQIINLADHQQKIREDDAPPSWFVGLVSDSYPATEYPIAMANGSQMILIIQANPLDEITEVWQESIAFFLSLLLLTLLTFIAINLAFNRSFKLIEKIIEGLSVIETGRYEYVLPKFNISEYDHIANAINHMSKELDQVQKENSALTKHSLEIQEEERQRLAQELHDELGQSLTAIKVMAVTAAHPDSNTSDITASITDICDHLMTVVRSMMYQLHPLILSELGLMAALDDMLNHWQLRSDKLNISMVCNDEVDRLELKMSIHIFRVIQECLTNIARHADAQNVIIKLSIQDKPQKILTLFVQDDGNGCDLDDISSGFGLRGMQERIKTLEGELMITSQLHQGMTITAEIPFQ